jgi:lysozyme family protein
MAASSYDEALRRLLVHEGGYANHPADPGGPTNFGITLADYRKYVKADADTADVKAMRVGEAKAIYRKRYWDALRCDELPPGVDYAAFDYGVNSGIARAGKVLRRCLGLADTNGRVTDEVIGAARHADAARLIAAICDERLAFLRTLKAWSVFGRGWERRVGEVRAAALVMATVSAGAASPARIRANVAGAAVGATAAGTAAQQAGLPLPLVFALTAAAALAAFAAVHFLRQRKG